jgi:dipeptidase
MKKIILFLTACSMVITMYSQSPADDHNCSTIIVGKDASATGFVMVAHNEDDGGNQIVNFYKSPGRDNEKGQIIRFKDGATEQQTSHSYAFLWFEMPGQDFSDTYINENGVLITSNSCPSKETFGEIVDGGIGYEFRRLIAERALSARVGVELAGQLVEKWGYNGAGRTYTIADKSEAWLFAVVRGKQWIAQRVPDDQAAFIPNYYTIKEVNLNDPDNFLASKDLVSYAERRGWYNREKDGPFNFTRVYSLERELTSMGNIGRMWMGVSLLSGNTYKKEDDFPVSFVPSGKIGMKEIMTVLTNHFEDTDFDSTDHYRLGSPHDNKVRPICSASQQFSFIAELRSGMTFDIGGRIWFAPRRGCVNAYIPFYFGITEIPASLTMDTPEEAYAMHFKRTESVYDRNRPMAWWNFVAVSEYTDKDYAKRIQDRQRIKDDLQKSYTKLATQFEKDYLPVYKKQPDKALSLMNQFHRQVLDLAISQNNKFMGK